MYEPNPLFEEAVGARCVIAGFLAPAVVEGSPGRVAPCCE